MEEPSPMSMAIDDGITMCEARSQCIDMVVKERNEDFRQAQANQAYNLRLLKEHRRAEEKLGVAAEMQVAEQEALLQSYRVHQAELQAIADSVLDEVSGRNDDDNEAIAADV